MNDIISILLDRFMNFIARALVPQSVFFIVFMFYDLIFSDFQKSIFLIQYFLNHWQSSLVFILIVGAGWGFITSFIYQIYDSFNSKNFNKLFKFNCKECFNLDKLRILVIQSLKKNGFFPKELKCKIEKLDDYQIYEILANKYLFKNLGSTTSFVDKATYVYNIALSFIINAILFLFIFNNDIPINKKIFYFLIITFVFSFIAIYNARKYYRKRNIRLYTNYLLIYDNKQKEESNDSRQQSNNKT